MPSSQCDTGADPFIARIFHDCVYNAWDYFGFAFGLASILTWMFAQFPQLVRNVRNKSAEALSVWFLAEWLLGDTCNLIGCLLTGDQLITQTYTAVYFICTDIALVMQYIYYGTLQRRHHRAARSQQRMRRLTNGRGSEDPESEALTRFPLISQLGQTPKPRVLACVLLLVTFGQLMSMDQPRLHASAGKVYRRHLLVAPDVYQLASHPKEWTKYLGQSIGWISSFFYLGSRLAQIYKNWSRQSAEGLSLAMFVCAIAANMLYGAGILCRTYALADLVNSAPWLLGSLGTVFLDAVIFSQFSLYHGKGQPEEAPLLEEEGSSD